MIGHGVEAAGFGADLRAPDRRAQRDVMRFAVAKIPPGEQIGRACRVILQAWGRGIVQNAKVDDKW